MSDLEYSSIPEVAPHQMSNSLIDKMYNVAPRRTVNFHPLSSSSNVPTMFREKIESLIPSVAKLLSGNTQASSSSASSQTQSTRAVTPDFVNCWTSTATAARQSSRTRVLNIQKDGTYTFWEELVMEPETPPNSKNSSPAVFANGTCPSTTAATTDGGEPPKQQRRASISGRRASLEPPKYRIRKSTGEWKLCINQGVTLILLKGVGTEKSGECGEYEENLSPRGSTGEKWAHDEPLSVEHLVNDWSSVSEDSMTELLC